jgi:hypothetical protein
MLSTDTIRNLKHVVALGEQHEHHQVHEDKGRAGEGEEQAGHGRRSLWHGSEGQGDKIPGDERRREEAAAPSQVWPIQNNKIRVP